MDHVDIPEDGGCPHAYLQQDRHDLREIAEEYHDGRRHIGKSRHQKHHADIYTQYHKDLWSYTMGRPNVDCGVWSFEKEIDQSSAIRPGNNERQISQRAAGKGVILVYPEDDACEYRNDIYHRKNYRGDEYIKGLFLYQRIDQLRDNK